MKPDALAGFRSWHYHAHPRARLSDYEKRDCSFDEELAVVTIQSSRVQLGRLQFDFRSLQPHLCSINAVSNCNNEFKVVVHAGPIQHNHARRELGTLLTSVRRSCP